MTKEAKPRVSFGDHFPILEGRMLLTEYQMYRTLFRWAIFSAVDFCALNGVPPFGFLADRQEDKLDFLEERLWTLRDRYAERRGRPLRTRFGRD